MTIKKHGGIFGRNPTFNDVTVEGSLNIDAPIYINGDLFSGLDYDGTWNANTNSPTITSSVGTIGHFYIVSVAGTTSINGEASWQVGDWIVFNGSVWQKVDGGSTGLLTTLTVTGNTYLATTSGDVGIGTTSPAYKLDIVGTNPRIRINETTGYALTSYLNTGGSFDVGRDNSTGSVSGAAYAGFLNVGGAYPLIFNTNSAERMRITSGGDVGIGTTSPQGLLDVRKDQVAATRVIANNQSATNGSSTNFDYYFGTTRLGGLVHGFNTSGAYWNLDVWNGSTATTRMTVDTSGNLGLGVTPSASWAATSKAIQLAASASIEGRTNDGSHVALYSNAVWNGTNFLYQNTATAAYYKQSSAVHSWYNAGAGTAGDPISFTQAMTLDASGNLLVGTSSAASSTAVKTVVASSGSCYSQWTRTASTIGGGVIGTEGQNLVFFTHTGTVGSESYSERMRIDSSGNVGVGTTSPLQKLAVNGGFNVVGAAALPAAQGSFLVSYEAPISRVYMGDGTGYSLAFSKRVSSTTTDLMTLTDAGNLGIGTASPATKLDVSGTITGTGLSMSGAAEFADGLAATPSITNIGDLDTGFYFPSANAIGVVTAGVNRMRFTSAGDVGIGNTSPGTKLDVTGVVRASAGMISNTAALATTATDGFIYVSTCAGAPTGVPTAQTGTAPIVIDTTNNKLYFYSGGAWRDAGP